MIRILLACAGGMSTSLLMLRMQEEDVYKRQILW